MFIACGFIFGYGSEDDVYDNDDFRDVVTYDSAGYDGLFEDEYPYYNEDDDFPTDYFDGWDW